MKQSFIKISKITEPPNSNIWVYPRGTKAQIKSRIKELQGLGVQRHFISRRTENWHYQRIG